MMTQILLYIFVLATALPVGLLLAWLCADELLAGKKWFKIILYSLVLIDVIFLLFYRNIAILTSLVYMILITGISMFRARKI